ncbi:GNAT family N-acetyltransferase [Streptomyces sp. NPDC057702]|uniref:GNAT family N-acetyltransferase n=1 Tax=unclassified Streptomyces TaxID=2593676 RepID=UPI0036745E5E
MTPPTTWLAARPLNSARLRLEPLRVAHAREMFPVLDDVRLHTWIGGTPDPPAQLAARYRRQVAGQSPDGTRGWLNWVVRRTSDAQVIGTVQATLSRPDTGGPQASLAWTIGVAHQGSGFGREAALAMARWLRAQGVTHLVASIHPEHGASGAIARALGLAPTDVVVDGEVRWSDPGA